MSQAPPFLAVLLLAWSGALANEVPNGDFSQVVGGNLAEWSNTSRGTPLPIAVPGSPGTGILRLDETSGTGGRFLRLETDGRSGGERSVVQSAPCPVRSGYIYELSWDYRASGLLGETVGNREDDGADMALLDCGLQPRPQYVAHAVMADALADAEYRGNRSTAGVSAFEFQRPDGPLLVAWANAGEHDAVFEASGGELAVMDIMGNTRRVAVGDGSAALHVGPSPIYLFAAKGTVRPRGAEPAAKREER